MGLGVLTQMVLYLDGQYTITTTVTINALKHEHQLARNRLIEGSLNFKPQLWLNYQHDLDVLSL